MFQKMNNMSNKKEWLQSFLFFEVMEIPFFEVILHTTTIIIPWSLVSINSSLLYHRKIKPWSIYTQCHHHYCLVCLSPKKWYIMISSIDFTWNMRHWSRGGKPWKTHLSSRPTPPMLPVAATGRGQRHPAIPPGVASDLVSGAPERPRVSAAGHRGVFPWGNS